jgi:hypothetical protein
MYTSFFSVGVLLVGCKWFPLKPRHGGQLAHGSNPTRARATWHAVVDTPHHRRRLRLLHLNPEEKKEAHLDPRREADFLQPTLPPLLRATPLRAATNCWRRQAVHRCCYERCFKSSFRQCYKGAPPGLPRYPVVLRGVCGGARTLAVLLRTCVDAANVPCQCDKGLWRWCKSVRRYYKR